MLNILNDVVRQLVNIVSEQGLSFSEEDKDKLRSLTEKIIVLEGDRKCTEQLLETETIKEKLLEFTSKKNQVQELNKDELSQKNTFLGCLKSSKLSLTNVSELIVSEIEQLHEQEQDLINENEDTISTLNRCLGDKSTRRIQLNELLESIEYTTHKRDDTLKALEEVMKTVSTERIQTRRQMVQYDAEKKELKRKLTFQETRNELLQSPYDELCNKLNDAMLRKQDRTTKLSHQNHKLTKLQEQMNICQRELTNQRKENQNFERKK
ncbi:hypothetical protein PHET_09358 [Paragonimus heterotremus]|uniref:Uncharacterized protein n=1 Tax=Paragonimus heterotremus TaxID=100268 RepID=A0A8J4SS55_9TREM|nr:hypothetical protein PHET_09358 [Paragonimus heterotremus]